ncbi:reverse transcriptase domain-containing protein [Tanacetum coccineum]
MEENLEAYVDDMVIKSTSEEGMLGDIQETFERFWSINMKLNPKKCSFGVEEGPFLGHLITKQGIKANPSKIKAVTKLEQPQALKDIQSLNRKLAALSRFLSKGAKRSLPFFKQEGGGDFEDTFKKNSHDNGSTEHDIVFLKRNERDTPADFLREIPFDDTERKVKEKEVSDPSSDDRFILTEPLDQMVQGAGICDRSHWKGVTIDLRFEFKNKLTHEAEYEGTTSKVLYRQEMEISKIAISSRLSTCR